MRSTAEQLSIEADLSKGGIGLVVLSVGGERLDTRNPTSKLMLTILAGVATWEREITLERQREGIAKAKATEYKGAPSQHRRGTDQAAARRVGSRRDREASRPGVRSTAHSDSAVVPPRGGSALWVLGPTRRACYNNLRSARPLPVGGCPAMS